MRIPGLFKKSAKRNKGVQLLPIVLDRKSTYVFPSRHGLLFLFAVFGMLAGSVNYNNNLGFLLAFLLGGIAFVSIFYTSRNLNGVRIVSAEAPPVYAGETAVFEFHLTAPAPERPAVQGRYPGAEPMSLNLACEQDRVLRIGIPAEKRGWLRPERLTVETLYPLGIFRCWANLRPDVSCIVYPRPEAAKFETSTLADDSDEEGEAGNQGMDDFQGLRNYQPGDSLKHISWKAYSRGQGLFTKVFEDPAGAGIFLDWDSLKELDTEKKLSQLCHMVLRAHILNIDYGLNLPGKTIEPARGENHKHQCLKALALFGQAE